MKNINIKLANGDELSFVGVESTNGSAYCVQTDTSVFTVMAQHIMWVNVSDYVEEKKEGNVTYVDFKKETTS